MKKLEILLFLCFYILILEGGARFFIFVKPVYCRIVKNDCNATWRWRWIERHNKGIVIYYSFDRYDATKGWALKPNISNMVCFKDKIVNSNSKGIRGKTEYAYGKNKNKPRILILGDSLTFGDAISDNETYPYCLQQMLPNAEVINFGLHGYGHDQMLIYLKEEGIKYKPDVIILGFISEDADRNMLNFRDYAKPKFELINNELKLCNSPVSPPDIILKEEIWRLKFIDLLSILHYKILVREKLYAAKREKLTNAILKEIVITTRSIGATPVFVYLDNIRSKESNNGMTQEEQSFFYICKNIKVDCVFLRSHLQFARRQGIKIKEKGHFDAKTCQIVALGIKEYLIKSGLIDKEKLLQ